MVESAGRRGVEAAIGTEVSAGASAAGQAVAVEIMPVPAVAVPDPATRKPKAAEPRWEPFEAGEARYTFDHLVDFAFT